jgi:hypothetical protein
MSSKTRYPELDYRQDAPGTWRIVNGGASVGPHYASKAELLADLERYAANWYGFTHTPPEDILQARLEARDRTIADLVAALAKAALSLEVGSDWYQSPELAMNAKDARAALARAAKVQS